MTDLSGKLDRGNGAATTLLVSLRNAVLLLAAVLLLVFTAELIVSLPDLIRYMRIRSM
ncbi:MAG TPA: hypothetical protein VFW96_04575 [Thermomicrobiales bacterium]|nr:hypothetical protein [Thermomicrobiales bacterium]